MESRILLILDVDETLIHAAESPLHRPADFRIGPYHVYRRPFLQSFLSAVANDFQVAFWSTASSDYVEEIVGEVWPGGGQPNFVWGRDRCTRGLDPERQSGEWLKDLRKVKRLGYDLRRVLIVDDTPRKVARHYGNAIYVRPFVGDEADEELRGLAQYLPTLLDTADVRRLEKRDWRGRIGKTPPT